MKAAWSAFSRSKDPKTRIGSREGHGIIMGLCHGARDLRPVFRKSRKIMRKNCAQNARIPALGYGAVHKKEESQEAP